MDKILEKFGLKYEDLNDGEREVLNSWSSALDTNKLTLDKVRDYISTMRKSVESDLTKIGHENKQDIFLKARLRNYMLLEAFLESPEKAKKAVEQQLESMARKLNP